MKGKELKNWRAKNNLTQLELAQHLNVKRVTVTRWEIGMRKISPFLHLALETIENRLMKKDRKGKDKTKQRKPKRKKS